MLLVSEGLNSVETSHGQTGNEYPSGVSEGLNSVETLVYDIFQLLLLSTFQKDLIVWKRHCPSI